MFGWQSSSASICAGTELAARRLGSGQGAERVDEVVRRAVEVQDLAQVA